MQTKLRPNSDRKRLQCFKLQKKLIITSLSIEVHLQPALSMSHGACTQGTSNPARPGTAVALLNESRLLTG